MATSATESTGSAATVAVAANSPESAAFDEEWEEWDGKSPFWHHCVAGSLAGVAEHTLVYPLDTVRTHIQVCAACPKQSTGAGTTATKLSSAGMTAVPGSPAAKSVLRPASVGSTNPAAMANYGMWQMIRHLVTEPAASVPVGNSAAAAAASPAAGAGAASPSPASVLKNGMPRLWRGVQTIMIGCVPAHALYFSTYEIVKAATLDAIMGEATAYGSMLAGAAAVFTHDLILTPLDTVKQRQQLGHYRGLSHALQTMLASEGPVSLYRSFPVTLATNIPYGMVMVGTNELLKTRWSYVEGSTDPQPLTLSTTLAASSVAGLSASALTTPLDRIKTYLQTQHLAPACAGTLSPPDHCPLRDTRVGSEGAIDTWQQAARRIYATEGAAGFFRGMLPRILSHTPAAAISWTCYESAKKYLLQFE